MHFLKSHIISARAPILTFLILALTQIACAMGGQGSPTPTLFVPPTLANTTASTPTLAATAADPLNPQSGDARTTVITAFDGLNNAYPYRLTETTTYTGEDATFTRIAEFAAENEVHTTWTGALGDGEYIDVTQGVADHRRFGLEVIEQIKFLLKGMCRLKFKFLGRRRHFLPEVILGDRKVSRQNVPDLDDMLVIAFFVV